MKKKILLILNLSVFIVPFFTLIEAEKLSLSGLTLQGRVSAVDVILSIFRNNFQDIKFWTVVTFVCYLIVCIFMFCNIIKLFIVDSCNRDSNNKKKRISDIPSIIMVIITTIVILMPYFLLVNNKEVELNTFGYLMFILMSLINMVTRIYFYYNKHY